MNSNFNDISHQFKKNWRINKFLLIKDLNDYFTNVFQHGT